ncbi:uncharacterized protein LOC100971826 isoform X6 [Pan paniscus]
MSATGLEREVGDSLEASGLCLQPSHQNTEGTLQPLYLCAQKDRITGSQIHKPHQEDHPRNAWRLRSSLRLLHLETQDEDPAWGCQRFFACLTPMTPPGPDGSTQKQFSPTGGQLQPITISSLPQPLSSKHLLPVHPHPFLQTAFEKSLTYEL